MLRRGDGLNPVLLEENQIAEKLLGTSRDRTGLLRRLRTLVKIIKQHMLQHIHRRKKVLPVLRPMCKPVDGNISSSGLKYVEKKGLYEACAPGREVLTEAECREAGPDLGRAIGVPVFAAVHHPMVQRGCMISYNSMIYFNYGNQHWAGSPNYFNRAVCKKGNGTTTNSVLIHMC